jgi:hypothetical protein
MQVCPCTQPARGKPYQIALLAPRFSNYIYNPNQPWVLICLQLGGLEMDAQTTTQKIAQGNNGQPSRRKLPKLPPVFSPAGQYGSPSTTRLFKKGIIYVLTMLLAIIPFKFTTQAANTLDCTAAQYDDGKVVLTWKTAHKADSLGFNVYREDKSGKPRKLNGAIIAGSGLIASAAENLSAEHSFNWLDENSSTLRKAVYYVEELDFSGHKTLYGPFMIVRTKGNAPNIARTQVNGSNRAAQQTGYPSSSLSPVSQNIQSMNNAKSSALQLSAKGGGEEYAAGGSNPQFELAANAKAIKLGVKNEGWYRVSYAELRGAGLSATVNPRRLKLMINGVEQPMVVNGEVDGRFDPADSIEFYGAGVDNLLTSEQVYWLVEGGNLGKRVTVGKGGNTGGTNVTGFGYTVERRDRCTYFSALINGDADNYFGALVISDGVDQEVEVSKLDANASTRPAVVEVSVQGVTETYHQVGIWFNGQYLGAMEFFGKVSKAMRTEIPQSSLIEGANLVHLTALGGGTDINLVESIRISYQRGFEAAENKLMMSANEGSAMMVHGFSDSRIRVMDVTEPLKALELAGDVSRNGNGYGIKVNVKQRGMRKLLAFAEAQIQAVDTVKANEPSSWNQRTNAADVVILTHEKFADSVERLKDLRQGQGYRVAVVNVEDVYDEYGYGMKSLEAIKELLKQTQNWQQAPRFVLLVGSASIDPRCFVWTEDSDYIPSKQVGTFYMECPSDDWLVDFDNDYLPELALGRLPVKSEAEAALVIGKIISYEQQPASQLPINSMLLVSDANDAYYDFEAFNDELVPLLPGGTQVGKVYRGQLGTEAAKSQLLAAINQGQSIVNYKGHGSTGLWRGNLLTSGDAANMTNSQNLSFFISMTCLNSKFNEPYSECLSSALLKAPNGGAIAVWSSSALTVPYGQNLLNTEIVRLLANPQAPMTIGEAARLAKRTTDDPDVRQSWILLGDPLTRLR